MDVLGWCKWCGNPITEKDFEEREFEFNPLMDELDITDWYKCSCGEQEISNLIIYKLVEKENSWEGLSKADPNYGIWEEDKED